MNRTETGTISPQRSDNATTGGLLKVENLVVCFHTRKNVVRAVDGVSAQVDLHEIVGLVGESGCGKSTFARAVMQLLPLASGRIVVGGHDAAQMSRSQTRAARQTVQMVFQDPYASLNPRMTVFDALAEPLRFHRTISRGAMSGEISRLMDSVGMARRFVRRYPHEFSGGQRQRIAIARALAVSPKLLIADEPVSALDVSVQAQILNLLGDLSRSMGLALLFISHDLSVVRYLCSRILVMYRGRIVEEGPCAAVLEEPAHPYTKALVAAVPSPDPARPVRTPPLTSDALSAAALDQGCRFRDRCPVAIEECASIDPPLKSWRNCTTRRVACILSS